MIPDKIFFTYNNASYSGYIVSSTDIEPHFHWFLFEDSRLIQALSDSIAFSVKNGELKPVHHYTRHFDLVEAVKKATHDYLSSHGTM